MGLPKHLDIELKLSGLKPAGYFVETLASPVQRRSEPVSLLLPEDKLAAWHSSLRTCRFDRERAKALGVGLFNALFPPSLRSILDESRGLARDEHILRLRLDIRTPELSSIPWELMHDGCSHLALGRRSAIVRYIHGHPSVHPAGEIHAPNILLTVATPVDVPALPAIEQEISHISESVSDLIDSQKIGRLEILRHTTLQKLQRKLREHPYHVLHYMGHGTFSHDEGFLALEDEDGTARWIDAETLSLFFRDAPLRLLVLNACQTALTSQNNALLGVAQAALSAGVPAVVAMQVAIKDELAAAFAHEFYLSLTEGHTLESGMSEGRKAIVGRATLDHLDWTIPVLFSNAESGLVWKLSATAEETITEAQSPNSPSTNVGNSSNINNSHVKQIVQIQGEGATVGETVNQNIFYESLSEDRRRKPGKRNH